MGQVPILLNLCEPGLVWHGSMLQWFHGRMGCEEPKRDLDNSFAVTRTRPDKEAAEHSNDEFSVDEWTISAYNFDQIWNTRMGAGGERKKQLQLHEEAAAEEAGDKRQVPAATQQAVHFDLADTRRKQRSSEAICAEAVSRGCAQGHCCSNRFAEKGFPYNRFPQNCRRAFIESFE